MQVEQSKTVVLVHHLQRHSLALTPLARVRVDVETLAAFLAIAALWGLIMLLAMQAVP